MGENRKQKLAAVDSARSALEAAIDEAAKEIADPDAARQVRRMVAQVKDVARQAHLAVERALTAGG